jgi:tetratricopeptide (TPR) repeat protein
MDDEPQVAFDTLQNRHLVEFVSASDNTLLVCQHNLIRSVAYNLLKASASTWKQAERQAAYLWLTAYKSAQDTPSLEIVRGYMEAFEHYCNAESWEQASTIFIMPMQGFYSQETLLSQLDIWGYYKEEIRLCERILGKFSRKIDIICFKGIGNAWLDLKEYEKAIDSYQKSRGAAREIGDLEGEGFALGNLGIAYYWMKKYSSAVKPLLRSLSIKRKIGDLQRESNTLGNLGLVYQELGEYDKALECHKESLKISLKVDYRRGQGNFLSNLGEVQIKLKQYSEALINLDDSLKILREVGDRANEAIALKNLAELHLASGGVEVAWCYCQQALILATELGIPIAAECQTLMESLDREAEEAKIVQEEIS